MGPGNYCRNSGGAKGIWCITAKTKKNGKSYCDPLTEEEWNNQGKKPEKPEEIKPTEEEPKPKEETTDEDEEKPKEEEPKPTNHILVKDYDPEVETCEGKGEKCEKYDGH